MNPTEDDTHVYFKSKRDQYVVEIRKRKNDEFLQQKRKKLTEPTGNRAANPVLQQTRLECIQQFGEFATSFFNAYKANNFEQLTEVTEKIRRAISFDENPPINQLIGTGVVPHIIKLLDYEHFEHQNLMVECAWIIANIASGIPAHVNYLLKHDIITKAMNLLDHPHDDVKDNAVWILSNIAGDSFENRDQLISVGIIPKLETTLKDKTYPLAFVGHVSWLISNICRGKPYPPFEQIKPFLEIIQFFIYNITNEEILNTCMWALSYFSDGDDTHIKAVLDLQVMGYIIAGLASDKPAVIAPALRTVGNLLTGSDKYTNEVIEAGAIPHLANLLNHSKKIFRREAAWAFSNLMAGTAHQIDQVFLHNNRQIIKDFINMVCNDPAYEIVKECIYCLTNACSEGTFAHVQILVDYQLIEVLVERFKYTTDVGLLKVCLEGLENILKYGQMAYTRSDGNPFILKLAQCGGFTALESLQTHPDNDIYLIVSKLIENYLDYETTS